MNVLSFTGRFKKDVKLCEKRGCKISLLNDIIKMFFEKGIVPDYYNPHNLSGNYAGFKECHIKSDCLLIWHETEDEENNKIITFSRTGTHADLF